MVALTGLAPPKDGRLTVTGSDPVLPTPYRVGTAAAAAQGVLGLALCEAWWLRTGRRQDVKVDLRAAAYALRSHIYATVDGAPAYAGGDAWQGRYPVRDGRYVQIQAVFAHLRDRALATLGRPGDVAAAKRASAAWDGLALEEAIDAAGGCATMVRTPAEWRAHPQSDAVASAPLVEIVRIGDAAPEPMPPAGRPLAGVRVLDLTRVLAGPVCTRNLAEHGAEVLKVGARHLADSGGLEVDTDAGKFSAFLDLRDSGDVAVLTALARRADVFVQSYRPGALAALGLSPHELAVLRPGIVYTEISAWGAAGPWMHRRGYDPNVQCATGMAHVQGNGSAEGTLLPAPAMDYVTGYLMALGTVVALTRRTREGGSWLVRASLARTAQWIVDFGLLDAWNDAAADGRSSGRRIGTHVDGARERTRARAYPHAGPRAFAHRPPLGASAGATGLRLGGMAANGLTVASAISTGMVKEP